MNPHMQTKQWGNQKVSSRRQLSMQALLVVLGTVTALVGVMMISLGMENPEWAAIKLDSVVLLGGLLLIAVGLIIEDGSVMTAISEVLLAVGFLLSTLYWCRFLLKGAFAPFTGEMPTQELKSFVIVYAATLLVMTGVAVWGWFERRSYL